MRARDDVWCEFDRVRIPEIEKFFFDYSLFFLSRRFVNDLNDVMHWPTSKVLKPLS